MRSVRVGSAGCRAACKPGSVAPSPARAAIPLEPASLRASRGQPGRKGGNAPASGPLRTLRRPPLFGLAPGGVYRAAPVAGGAVRSCRTLSPLPGGRSVPAVCFLWHCPWALAEASARRPLAGTVFPWSPDFPPAPDRSDASGRPATRHPVAVWGRAGRRVKRCAERRGRGPRPLPAGRPRRHSPVCSQASATAASRASVSASARPSTRAGRQCRWKAGSSTGSGRSAR